MNPLNNILSFITLKLLAVLTLLPLTVTAQDAPPSPPTAKNVPLTEPLIRLDKEGKPMQFFLDRHESFLKRGKEGPIDVLFIGDSITQGWTIGKGKEIWNKYYAPLNAANFGIGGDGTQSVLWRIANGELDDISPKVVVLLIGINNSTRPGVADGIKKIAAQIREKLPHSKLLLLGIFPRMERDGSISSRLREHTAAVNRELATLDDGKHIRFLDLGEKFIDTEGKVPKEYMPDGLHPAAAGYQIWAEEMQPLLDEMLKE
jgi:beta-glucosidase